jgi:hypothetical protein
VILAQTGRQIADLVGVEVIDSKGDAHAAKA